MTYAQMLALARSLLRPKQYSEYFSAGYVAAVLEGANGRYYTGVNIDLACGLGFCAERSAASAMITDGEVRVRRIVCVDSDGSLMTPCGSCREFLFQLSPENARAEFLVGEDPPRTVPLSRFLPYPWQAGREQKDDR